MTETTLRDDLEAAVDAFETEEAPPEPTAAPEPEAEPQEAVEAPEPQEAPQDAAEDPSPGRRRDAKGRFLSDEGHPDDETRYPNLTDDRVAKAPAGWRPGAREGWADLPEAVQREIHRRELDIATGQQQTAGARDVAERFQSTVAPFLPVMEAQGIQDPMEAVKGLLGTAAALHTGTPEQKAARLAEIFTTYNVDLDAFDKALAGRIEGKPSVPDPVQAAIDARLGPLEQELQSFRQHRDTAGRQTVAEVDRNIAEFGKNAEFLADVRLDMADILEAAATRGRNITLQDAYDAACQMNPEIKGLLAKRAAPPPVQDKAALAASSLSNRQNGPTPQPGGDGSLRGDIEAAIERLQES